MGAHDQLIEKWRERHAKGDHPMDVVMDTASLRPDSFCVSRDVVVDSPVGSGSILAFFDSPADFVAFLRWSETPWELHVNGEQRGSRPDVDRSEGMDQGDEGSERGRPDLEEPAEAYLGRFDASTDTVLRQGLARMDAILGQDEIDDGDAIDAMFAYNELFELGRFRRFESRFGIVGGVVDVLREYREWYQASDDEEVERPYDAECVEAKESKLGALVDSGTFDPDDPEHLKLAREVLAVVQEYLM